MGICKDDWPKSKSRKTHTHNQTFLKMKKKNRQQKITSFSCNKYLLNRYSVPVIVAGTGQWYVSAMLSFYSIKQN